MTFVTTRVVGLQPYAPAAFTPGEIPGTHFQKLSETQGTWFCRGEPRKKYPVTPPGTDPGTVLFVVQCLNHYATPVILVLYIYKKHLESFEICCWRKMEKISCTDHVRNKEVLLRVNEQRNILHEISKQKAN